MCLSEFEMVRRLFETWNLLEEIRCRPIRCFEFKEQLFLKTSDTTSSWLHTCMFSLCFFRASFNPFFPRLSLLFLDKELDPKF